MTSKSLRRLASDHASLHTKGLPPNYLFPPGKDDDFSDLTSLSILLAGPEGTAFSQGVYTLELSIPPTYPQTAPTAHFRTKIFHPNVDPASGAICVDTLKRDWKPELTLRDILVTITCLLVYPNPASALNAEAGRLIEDDFAEYERKARLWARMHAATPQHLQDAVEEARKRGDKEPGAASSSSSGPALDKRKRKDKKMDSEDVFVREDSVKMTTPPKKQMMAAPPPPLPKGLGIDTLPESSLNSSAVQLDTPTQQPPPRRRKKPAQEDDTNSALAPSSFTASTPTPTPGFKPLIHSNPSTPRLGQPEPKRRRLTPEKGNDDYEEQTTPRKIEHQVPRVYHSSAERDDERPWLSWQTLSPASSPEDDARRKRRRLVEQSRLDSVGGSLLLYNAGRFGPRTGVERL